MVLSSRQKCPQRGFILSDYSKSLRLLNMSRNVFLLLTKSFPGLSDEARSRASKCNQVWVLSVVVILHIILSSCQLLILPVLTKNVYHFLLSGFWTFLKGQTHLFSSLVVRPITKWVNLLGKVWVQYWTYFQDLFDYISEFGDPGLDESISHKFFSQVKTKPSSEKQ